MAGEVIDLRTVFLLTTFVSMTTAAAMVFLWRSHPGEAAAPLWALGALLAALGYLGIGLRGMVPALVSVPLANACITAGHAYFLAGTQRLAGRPPLRWSLVAALAGTSAMAMYYFTFVQNNTAARIAIQFAVIGLLSVTTAWRLWSPTAEATRLTHRAVAIVFLVFGAILLLRVGLMPVDLPQQNLFAPSVVHYVVFVALLLFYAFLMYCFPALLFAHDIARRHLVEDALEHQKDFLNTILEGEPECVMVLGSDGSLLQMNQAGLAMLEVADVEAARQRGWVSFIDPGFRAPFAALSVRVFGGERGRLEFPLTGTRGTRRWLETYASPLCDAGGYIGALVAVTRDITERKAMVQELERQAHTDYLTSIANRRHFLDLAEKELARIQRYGGTLSLLMLDIDHFKHVNDTYGHQSGDEALRCVAATCAKTLRETDLIGRYGGEEFAVLLPETAAAEALEAAERLRRAVAEVAVPVATGATLVLTISVGVATSGGGDATLDDLLRATDTAMYEAKAAGRNCVRSAA